MKLAVLSLDDPWSDRVQRDRSAATQMFRSIPTDVFVRMESVEFMHHGPDQRFRPYLHLQGTITQLVPEEALPYGVKDLPYKPGSGPRLDAFYEFTDTQLADLVAKGYFTKDFRIPEDMVGLEWDLPGSVDYLMVYPEYTDEVPVVFAGVRDRNDLVLTAESSGYVLDEYFQPIAQSDAEVAHELTETQRSEAWQYEGGFVNLFADDPLDEYRAAYESDRYSMDHEPIERDTVPETAFDRLVAQAEDRYAQYEQETVQAETDEPDSIRYVYESKIAPQVESVLAGPQQEAAVDEQVSDESERDIESGAHDQDTPTKRARQRRQREQQTTYLFADDDALPASSRTASQDEPEL